MATPQRLPIVNNDDGVWGDIIRQYLKKEHYDDGTDNAVNGGHQTITIRPGTATAGTSPLKFTSGSLLTTPEAGAVEFNTDSLYITSTTGPTRKKIAAFYDGTSATGDLYYRDAGGNFVRLGVGSSNQVLTVAGGLPSWGTAAVSIGWTVVTATSQTAVVNSGYVTNNVGLVTVTLPATATVGSIIEISGMGAGGWKLAQPSGIVVHFGMWDTTTGTSGYLASTNKRDAVRLVCIVANTEWNVAPGALGNISIV